MKKNLRYLLTGAALLVFFQAAPVLSIEDAPPTGAAGPVVIGARLAGFTEVPSVSSTGSGEFKGLVSSDRTEIQYKLTYEALEGTAFMAHIHLGQFSVNGGIMVWFCGDPGHPTNPPPATVTVPLCGPTEGAFEGTITAADVIGPAGQGIAAGEFEEVLRAIARGVTYVNVHTNKHTGGEIRGQVQVLRP